MSVESRLILAGLASVLTLGGLIYWWTQPDGWWRR